MAKPADLEKLSHGLAVVALVAAAALPLTRLFQPGGVTGVIVLSLALSALVSWATRSLRAGPLTGAALSILALAWFLAVRFFPDTLWGPFPTGRTVAAFSPVIREGLRQTIEEVVPVVATPPLLLFVAAGVWVTAWLADVAAIALRNPLLGIAGTVPMFAVPGTLVESRHRLVDIGLYAGAAAWVLLADQRARAHRLGKRPGRARLGWRLGTAARLGFAGIALAIVASPVLPGYGGLPGFQGTGFGDRVLYSPLVAIKPTLGRRDVRTVFVVRAEQPTYYRLTALDIFDGKAWTQERERTTHVLRSPFRPPDMESRRRTEQFFEIRALAGPWLPASYFPVFVDGIGGSRLDAGTGTLLRRGGLEYGLQYFVTSYVPAVTARALDGMVSYDRAQVEPYLALPRGLPAAVRDVARSVAGSEPTPFRKAVALQNYLRRFTYDEKVAAGHGYSTIEEFLTKAKRGYCEQFAGSMAVLARVLGIPSRVAIGFGAGTETTEDIYRVTTKHAHAWVELFFPGKGWIAFEPTPRTGVATVPAYTVLESPQGPGTGPAGSAEEGVPPEGRQSPRSDPARPEQQDPSAAGTSGADASAWSRIAVIAGGVMALAGGLLLAGPVRRRIRRRRVRTPREAVLARYVDFLSWCASAGLGRSMGETPHEHAVRLTASAAEAEDPLHRLADLVGVALWAPGDGVDVAPAEEAASRARAALAPTLSRSRRLRANLISG